MLRATASTFQPDGKETSQLKSSAKPYQPTNSLPPAELSAEARLFLPHSRRKQLCRFFARGGCSKGLQCPFEHDTSIAVQTIREESALNVASSSATTGTTISFDDGIVAKFGAGAVVEDMQLGQQGGVTLFLIGLPNTISETDIRNKLIQYGEITKISIRFSGENNEHTFALVAFADSKVASNAALHLHGTSREDWTSHVNGNQRHQASNKKNLVVLAFLKTNDSSSKVGLNVKVQWYAASKSAWINFSQRWQYQKAANALHGRIVDGRKLDAKAQRPSKHQTTSFTVIVNNLADETSHRTLSTVVAQLAKCKPSSLVLQDAPYSTKDTPSIVQGLLETHGGPLISMVLSDEKSGSLKQRALARFAFDGDAHKACRYFSENTRVEKLAGSRLFLQIIYSVKYSIPNDAATILFADARSAISHRSPGCSCKLFPAINNVRALTAQVSDKEEAANIQSMLDPIIIGDTLLDKNKAKKVWSKEFRSFRFQAKLNESLSPVEQMLISFDTRRNEVRVRGSPERRAGLMSKLRTILSTSVTASHAVPIQRAYFETILLNGRSALDKITRATCGASSVSLDIGSRSLLVVGQEQHAKRAQIYIDKMLSGKRNEPGVGNENSTSEEECAICLCPPDPEASVLLSCKHAYCRPCFESWLLGTSNCSFPLTCLNETCTEHLSMHDLKVFLNSDDLHGLLHSALGNHIRRHPHQFQYCEAPGCSGIYRSHQNEAAEPCSLCGQTFCFKCNVLHEGMSCESYQSLAQPVDTIRLKIVDEVLTLRCPRCKAAFLDFNGCFALHCHACPCQFCGWCLEDCGDANAHPHVRYCGHKEEGAGAFFGSEEMFHSAQNKRRKKLLIQFLENLQTEDQRQNALASITNDLNDLGIHLSTDIGGS